MSIAASRFEVERVYSENEVSDLLRAWLSPFASPIGLDHVTFRRLLVDMGFLTRDMSGASYHCSRQRSAEILSDDARLIDPGRVLNEINLEKKRRKQKYRAGG